jgi:two-component system cell cycle sensor histidine kinase/response regulator CckA
MRQDSVPDFRVLFESAPGLYLVLTPEFRIAAASDAYLRATMTTRETILGRDIFDIFPDTPGALNLRASLDRVLRTRRPDAMDVQQYGSVNCPVVDAWGEVVYIIHRIEDLKKAGSQPAADALLYDRIHALMARADDVLRTGSDVPKAAEGSISPEKMLARVEQLIVGHKQLEEQLLHAQKMEAVGRLAGGIAHDFNNLLTVITGFTSLLLDRLPPDVPAPELEEIDRAATRAAALTGKLLAFSRKQMLQVRIIDLNTVVTGMGELLRRLIGENIMLVTALGSGLGKVKADPGQIEQVIMNLAVNARDAMPKGGKLIIETRTTQVEVSQIPRLRPGAYVVMSVTDTGHGMDAEVAGRIFEPFFTTKEPGKGTGLGLATSYGIVEQSGGALTVESKPGEGAVFRAYLPLATGENAEEPPVKPAAQSLSRAATILLVEDEAPLRKLVGSVLNSAGYRVLAAANADEAMLLASQNTVVDLLVTDVMMPGASGPDLVAKLHKGRGDFPVLYMSGYDGDMQYHKPLEGSAKFLQKPFTPRVLLAAIGEMLGAQAA